MSWTACGGARYTDQRFWGEQSFAASDHAGDWLVYRSLDHRGLGSYRNYRATASPLLRSWRIPHRIRCRILQDPLESDRAEAEEAYQAGGGGVGLLVDVVDQPVRQ